MTYLLGMGHRGKSENSFKLTRERGMGYGITAILPLGKQFD